MKVYCKVLEGFVLTAFFLFVDVFTCFASVTDNHRTEGTPAYTDVQLTVRDSGSDSSKNIGTIPADTVFRFKEQCGSFLKVRYGKQYGFVRTDGVLTGDEVTEFARDNESRFLKMVTVIKDSAKLFSAETRHVSAVVQKGAAFMVANELDYFYKVSFDDKEALILKEDVESSIYVKVTDFSYNTEDVAELLAKIQEAHDVMADARQIHGSTKRLQSAQNAQNLVRNQIVQYAMQFVGNPYVWGGTSLTDGTDCSGFTKSVLEHFGIEIPRCSYEQAGVGVPVPLYALQPGDLVFYKRGTRIGHVVMYAGNGKVVQARGSEYGIVVTDLDYNTPYCAVDVLSEYLN